MRSLSRTIKKSITNRALLLAALADGDTTLQGVLFSDDSRVFMEALKTLGFSVDIDEENAVVKVTGSGGKIPERQASVYVGSAGTAARFLTAMLAFSGGTYEVTSSDQMKRRPMRPLLEALELLGSRFEYREEPYAFPFPDSVEEIKKDIRKSHLTSMRAASFSVPCFLPVSCRKKASGSI